MENTLKITDFTENKEVLILLEDLKNHIAAQKAADPEFGYSDAVDDEGKWYVDLVQEGGGVLGVALLGYTYVMEQAGVRFLKLAGTSAGAINTVMMAAADVPSQERSPKVLSLLAQLDLFSFVDGDEDAKDFIEALNGGAGISKLLWKGFQVLDNLKNDIGLNPGKQFFDWMVNALNGFGIETVQQLRERMEDLPPELKELIYPAEEAEARQDDWPFAVVAADITTESKAVFPRHGYLYFQHPEEVNPAYYVRASMSVPLFFSPLRREAQAMTDNTIWENEGIPQEPSAKLAWEGELEYKGPHPKRVMFVDGGILSNFPIDIFHSWDKVPRRPTFGVKLGLSRNTMNDVEEMDYKKLLLASFNAARLMRDQDFIHNNPEYRKLVAQIDIADHNWLDFALTDEAKVDLFRRGAQTAADFLKNFDWKAYKTMRQNQLLSMANEVTAKILGINLADTLEKVNARRDRESGASASPRVRTRGLDPSPAAPAPSRSEIDPPPKKTISESDKKALESRIKLLGVLKNLFRVLWIDDQYHPKTYNKQEEINLINSLGGGGEVRFAKSSAEARELLLEKEAHFDLIVSDIKRGDNGREGVEFLVKLVQELGREKVPPTIFYITNFDPLKGTPPFAFGITNSLAELVHLTADVLQRQ